MRRWAVGLMALLPLACSDPAAIELRVVSLDPDTHGLEIGAEKVDADKPALRCRFAEDQAPAGDCPLEAGTSTFALSRPASVVIYGPAGTSAELRAIAYGASDLVLGSTHTVAQLPAAGQRKIVNLVIPARTAVTRRLDVDFENQTPPSGRTNSALLLADIDGDGVLEVIAMAGGRVLVFELKKHTGLPAELALRSVAYEGCTVRPFGAVLANFDAQAGSVEIGLVCTRVGTTAPRFLALALDANGAREIGALTLDVSANLMSRPVAFDPSGDGHEAMAILVGSTTTVTPSVLEVWRPDGLHQSADVNVVSSTPPYGPVVSTDPVDGHQLLLLAGNRGGPVVRFERGTLKTNAGAASSLSPASMVRATRARLAITRDSGSTQKTSLVTTPIPTGQSVANVLPVRITGPVQVAIAIGDVDADGIPDAVMGIDGTVEYAPFDDAMTPAHTFVTDASLTNVMTILLANIDAHPGAEVISFLSTGGRIYAHDARGKAVPGWPIDLGEAGVDNRVALADLDGDGAIEVVDLSHSHVSIVSLGPGTYDPSATPWPAQFGDRGHRSESRGEADPGWGMAGQ